MAVNLPSNPTVGETFLSPSGILYEWSGTAWNVAELTDYPFVARPVKTRVNAGQEVVFDGFAYQMPTAGNRSLQVRRLSGTGDIIGASNYTNQFGNGGANLNATPLSVSTTFVYFVNFTWTARGVMQEVVFQDLTTTKQYRVTLIVGSGYNNNIIIPQLLHTP
jgi:hypothetical protein